jgi:epoxyqueuosine reductase
MGAAVTGTREALKRELTRRAVDLGFDALAVAAPDAIEAAAPRYRAFIEAGWHGDMAWMADTAERRERPLALWPQVRSVVMVAMNYGPDHDPLGDLDRSGCGVVSVYARGRDYHDVMKGRLKQLAGWLHRETRDDVKVFVDTAPVLEKPLAAAAGLGWQGKHTNLVSRDFGSWLFLGAIFTAARLPADRPEQDHCGTCRACLDICPTDAFPEPYRLDARKCISYLTIEHKGTIPRALRSRMGNRIYGCDDCLAVCPWNKYARSGREAKLAARDDLEAPALDELARLDDRAFRARFAGSPVKRIGRDRFVRNVLIALGNSRNAGHLPLLRQMMGDPSPLVRAMAVWAHARLGGDVAQAFESQGRGETDAGVRAEWLAGGAPLP